jgi:hypothetical protein
MAGRKKTVQVQYLSVYAEGATRAEAKANAERFIERAMRASYTPVIITVHGHRGIIWRDSSAGIVSALIREDGSISGCHSQTSHDVPMESAAEWMRLHLGQNAWTPAVEDDEAFITGIGFSHSSVADELRSWIAFQRRYQAALADGKSKDEAYDIASGGRIYSGAAA